MMVARRIASIALCVSSLVPLAMSSVAHADGVTFSRGQFTDRVERSLPTGDASSLAHARQAIYWIETRNAGEPTTVTLVWSLDGREVARQSLNVGRARWRTWGTFPTRHAHTIRVQVLDASGASLHTDETTLTP